MKYIVALVAPLALHDGIFKCPIKTNSLLSNKHQYITASALSLSISVLRHMFELKTRNIHQLIITTSGLDPPFSSSSKTTRAAPWLKPKAMGSDCRKPREEMIMCCVVSSATSGYLFGQAKDSVGIPLRSVHLTADELVEKDHVSEPRLTCQTHTHTNINITPLVSGIPLYLRFSRTGGRPSHTL